MKTPLKLVSCGMDGLIRIWQCEGSDTQSFHTTATLEGHEDIVRDVAWRNSTYDCFASGGDVIIDF
jgi:WD40 repeat protein